MPKLVLPITEADNLRELKKRLEGRGFESPILDLRVQYNEHAVVINYLNMVAYTDRVFHHLLPTQASGRWSVTNPPLVNFPDEIRDTVIPDSNEAWVAWDLDAIEGKIVACYSHDKDDLEAFRNNHDIHTITACRMIHMPLPPNLRDPHQAADAAEWRQKYSWKGKEDRRRILAKVRYALLYGRDHTAIHESKYEKDMVKMGFDRDVMLIAAKQFLASKPGLKATKMKYWRQSAMNKEARTIFGRRRRLFGDYWAMAKEGWNHMVQGSVTDMVNMSLIEICSHPNRRLIYPSHDAAKIAVPLDEVLTHEQDVVKEFKRAVERTWTVDGEEFVSTATWHIYFPDGTVKHLKG